MKTTFSAFEYTKDGRFEKTVYAFDGDCHTGWQIHRKGRLHLTLGKGYQMLKTRLCGICASDIDRKFYPFPLPQIIGHEVVAQTPGTGDTCVVEINDTPYYRGDVHLDAFGKAGLFTHTPGRMVLGIDRLPGGFGPYILVPEHAVVPLDDFEEYTAVLIEPFAAALQAVYASPPEHHDQVAVLGPRRLGALLTAALAAYKRSSRKNFSITALARHPHLLKLCRRLGADKGIDLTAKMPETLSRQFDIVYDTTGTASGFETALHLAKREVHLKSTNGQEICGLKYLTGFVVDELSLLPFSESHLDFTWQNEDRKNTAFYQAAEAAANIAGGKKVFKGTPPEAETMLSDTFFQNRLPRFDIAIATSLREIDTIIRPSHDHESALVRPRGAILFHGNPGNNPLLNFIAKGGILRSSRCGNFHTAMSLLNENKKIAGDLAHNMISHVFPVRELPTAFDYAKKSRALKVVVNHDT